MAHNLIALNLVLDIKRSCNQQAILLREIRDLLQSLVSAKDTEQKITQKMKAQQARARRDEAFHRLFWAALYGKHMYSFFVASEGGASLEAKEFFETELMENELLCSDFPEVCGGELAVKLGYFSIDNNKVWCIIIKYSKAVTS